MPPNLQKYLRLKTNPVLGLFQSIREMEKQIETLIREAKLELKESMAEEIEKRTKVLDPTIEQLVRNVLKDIKGEKGDKGDSIKGEKGNDGYTPIKDKNYFDGKDGKNGSIIKKVFVNEKGELIMQIDD